MRNTLLAILVSLLAVPASAEPAGHEPAEVSIARTYGPFQVLDHTTAAIVGATDERTPAQFRAMLRDHPGLETLRFVDCPGTYDDRANLALGRLIRQAGLVVEVPAGGSVRSGGVELVLAGVSRRIADDAEFAVHAWEDEDGRNADEYRMDAPEHAKYLEYYREMGLADPLRFYAMTNSAPFEEALWLTGSQMREWVGDANPSLVYLDLGDRLH